MSFIMTIWIFDVLNNLQVLGILTLIMLIITTIIMISCSDDIKSWKPDTIISVIKIMGVLFFLSAVAVSIAPSNTTYRQVMELEREK